ncbi:hypothetical protein ACIRN4_16280 [Pimelobacter simplex]|uniref:hypothetical protein n=1 Tax=Nocardioides simplex TaxID=2045 RepID=UPI0038171669
MSNSSSDRKPLRYSRIGSVLLSYDFAGGVAIGLGAASLVGASGATRSSASGLLIGAAGVSAAVATLVLTSLTVLLTTISAEYRSYLRQLPGGVAEIAVPFRIIVAIGGAGALAGLIGSFLVPAVATASLGGFKVWAAAAAAPGLVLSAWAILGCVQLTEQFVTHWVRNDKVLELEERRRRALARNAG